MLISFVFPPTHSQRSFLLAGTFAVAPHESRLSLRFGVCEVLMREEVLAGWTCLPVRVEHVAEDLLELSWVMLHLWNLHEVETILPNRKPLLTIVRQVLQNCALENWHAQTVDISTCQVHTFVIVEHFLSQVPCVAFVEIWPSFNPGDPAQA